MTNSKIQEHKVVAHTVAYLMAGGKQIIGMSINKKQA